MCTDPYYCDPEEFMEYQTVYHEYDMIRSDDIMEAIGKLSLGFLGSMFLLQCGLVFYNFYKILDIKTILRNRIPNLNVPKDKKVKIIRGVPGVGKRNYVYYLENELNREFVVIDVNDYFTKDEEYKFDGKNLAEALERNLIGTDIIGGTKDILAMSPEEREARAKVKQEQIAELNIDMPTGFGFIEAPPVQTDMSLEEAKQKFEAGKQRVAKERAETEAGVAAMRKQAFDNLKDTVTGNRAMAVELAGGGLLKQAGKRSGPPPEKGPGGLASLEDYARTMME